MQTVIETTGHEVTAEAPANINQRPTAATADFARQRFAQIVSEGTRKASGTIRRIFEEVPQDSIVRANALRFDVGGGLRFGVPGSAQWETHPHAYRQLLERAGIPKAYADGLFVTPWGRDLLTYTLSEHYRNTDGRYLVRAVNGEARGVLSDSFRRLDSRPLLDAFARACVDVDAVPYEGAGSVIKSEVRFIVPKIVEPVPGEQMVFGVSWKNSDYGASTYGISAFVLRLVCLNGAVGASALKQVHLGGKLPEEIEFSEQTYRLDTERMVSATTDVVRATLGPASIDRQVEAIRAATSKEGSYADLSRPFAGKLNKGEGKAVKEAFEGQDVVNLPAGNTAWRMSNALSWIANETEDAERKIELQSYAGQLIG